VAAWGDTDAVRPTALIVDDHPTFRRMAHRLLGAAGYQVVGEAGDAQSAVAAVRRMHPQFVLLDVLLPDGDGIAVADQIGGPGGPVVVLTSSRSAAELGPALRGRSFITKSDLTIDRLQGLVDGG
jgi:DNA-binding NarL/FixJ family response regulator